MKKLLPLIFVLSVHSIWSQSSGINFQSIILDANGQIEQNLVVQLEFAIDNANGNTVYSERQTLTTDTKGIINVIIGNGTPTVGTSLSNLDWNQAYTLEIFRLVGDSYQSQGSSSLQSVPYSFVSKSVSGDGLDIRSGLVSATSASFSGIVTATSFIGDGSQLTNLNLLDLENDISDLQAIVATVNEVDSIQRDLDALSEESDLNSSTIYTNSASITSLSNLISDDNADNFGAGTTMASLSSGIKNTAVGSQSLEKITTGSANTAVGYKSLNMNSTGTDNTAIGTEASFTATDANENVAVGNYSLFKNLKWGNTAVGFQSMYNNTTGNRNVALGVQALLSNTTASYNTAVGYQAGYSVTTGQLNTAVGNQSLRDATTGQFVTAIGGNSLERNTTASYNTAVGYQSGFYNTTAQYNTFIGYKAGFGNTPGQQNTFVGCFAGESTTGEKNTFVGESVGCTVTTGTRNTIIGRYNGNQDGLDIRASSNNIVLSDGDGNPRYHLNSSGSTNIYSTGTGIMSLISNYAAGTSQALLTGVYSATDITGTGGTVSLRIWTNGNIQNTNNSYTALSDQKLKENIVDANPQWDDIKALRVRNYNMIEGQTHRQIGLIAQEVETVSAGLVYDTADYDASGNDFGTVTKSVNYSVLYMKAVKALQEAMDRIETLEAKVTALENA